MLEIDLHGYRPRTLESADLVGKILQQAWETGAAEVVFIHGHGRFRQGPPQFVNSNTGYLGLTVRSRLRHDKELRRWMYVRIDVSHPGSTVVRLRPNPNPTRTEIGSEIFPERDFSG